MVDEEKGCCVIVSIEIAESVRDGAESRRQGSWQLIVLPSSRLSQFSVMVNWMRERRPPTSVLDMAVGGNEVRCLVMKIVNGPL